MNNSKRLPHLLLGLASCILLSVGQPATTCAQIPAGVVNTQNPKDLSLTPQETLKQFSVPDGFNVTLFAGEPHVAQPISFTFDDRGRLWVAECFSHPKWSPTGKDRILIFEDTNGDGKFDKRTVFYDKANFLTGLVVGHGGVWICNVPNLMFIPDRDGDDIPDGEPEIVLDGWKKTTHNNLNNLIWGPDGWLYGCVGFAKVSEVGKPGTPQADRAKISRGIWRYHPIKEKFEVVANGLVNPWGLDFNDEGEGVFSNCVLPHLWHLIPGAYYDRRGNESDNIYAYERIKTIADHLHWGGGNWTSSRGGKGSHSIAGGGHAHTGAMIYLGDNWPDRYRHTFFTGNLHGNRINNDRLEPSGSGYIGRHNPDFLTVDDKWFRSLSQKYGPDGSVFVSDWHDFGECHDNDGSHRTSGRIYRIRYGKDSPALKLDLRKNSSQDLVKLMSHKNDWYVRHARRLLQERAASGQDMAETKAALRKLFQSSDQTSVQLRALWALHGIGQAPEQWLLNLTVHDNAIIRSWAVRLLCEDKAPRSHVRNQLLKLAKNDPSPRVRLYLASMLQRMPTHQRWDIANALQAHTEDASDHNIPLMVWYGIEPAIKENPTRALKMAQTSKMPLVRKFIARRLAEPE